MSADRERDELAELIVNTYEPGFPANTKSQKLGQVLLEQYGEVADAIRAAGWLSPDEVQAENAKALREAEVHQLVAALAPKIGDGCAVEIAGWRVRAVAVAPTAEEAEHIYLSTACTHTLHSRCRLTCKFCGAGCGCDCHTAEQAEPEPPQERKVVDLAAALRESVKAAKARREEAIRAKRDGDR